MNRDETQRYRSGLSWVDGRASAGSGPQMALPVPTPQPPSHRIDAMALMYRVIGVPDLFIMRIPEGARLAMVEKAIQDGASCSRMHPNGSETSGYPPR
nr:hypothetical protein [Tolivirales sp.]